MTKPVPALTTPPSAARRVKTPLVWLTGAGCLLVALGCAQAQGLRRPNAPGPSGQTALPLPVAPSPAPSQRQADFIVAVVNSEPVTNNELRSRILRTEQQLAQQGGNAPARDELQKQVLELIINEKAQLHFATESGVKIDELAVDEAENNVARQNQIDRAELRRRLAQDGLPLAQFRDELRKQLLLSKLRERDVPARVRVNENDVDQFLRDQARTLAAQPSAINLAMILVAVPENSTPTQVAQIRTRAQAATDRARAGADFAGLARDFSDASDRGQFGGELGLRPPERYPALFVEATQALAVGQIAGPVQSDAGFHILKVLEKRHAGSASASASVAQARARHILLVPHAQMTEAQAKTRLADMRRQIQAGQADFAALAREHSQDGSASAGGDLGWAGPGQFVPEFEDAMNRLKPGDIGEPLVSRFGVHLIQLQERRDHAVTQTERREAARRLLREQKSEEAFVTWAQEIRGRAYVEMREPPLR